MNTIGKNIQVTVFGESHGQTIGVVIDGLEAGIALDIDAIRYELLKRRPKSKVSTPRVEMDEFAIVSGYSGGVLTGAALTILVPNANTASSDYDQTAFIPRPGHADYPAYVKYNGFHDKRGGGIFSGRMTVLLVIAGAIAKQILERKGIIIASHIDRIGSVVDSTFHPLGEEITLLKRLQTMDFPVIESSKETAMKQVILEALERNDSVGGSIESMIQGVQAGIGEPLYRSIESTLAQYLFSIPAIKGVSFGDGFEFAKQTGTQSSDGYIQKDGHIQTIANHNGGILGGISTSMPIIVHTVFKPTSSIASPQVSVDLLTNQGVQLEIKGRHDPAIVNRGIHVVNAVLYLGMLDLYLDTYPRSWMKE